MRLKLLGWRCVWRAASVALCIGFAMATSAQTVCTGDCNGSDSVTIEELILAVNIALGTRPVTVCPAIDPDNSGTVVISELIGAVNGSLNGCFVTPPTPRDTPTATPTQRASATDTFTSTPTVTSTPTATSTIQPTDSATPESTPTPTIFIIDLGGAAVVNELDHSVSFLAGDHRRQAGSTPPDSVALDGIPRAVAIAGDGRLAYVTLRDLPTPGEPVPTSGAVAVIDVTGRRVAGILEGVESLPEAIACTPNGSAILVTNFGSDSVSIINEGALRAQLTRRAVEGRLDPRGLSTTVKVGAAPNGLAITTDSARAYVTNYGSRSVSVIDIGGRDVVETVTVGDNPNSVALSPDGQLAYVSDFTSMTISVISTVTNKIVRTIPINLFAETRPTSLTFSPSGLLYITSFNLSFGELFGSVLVLNPAVDPPFVKNLDFRDLDLDNALPAATRVTADGQFALVSNFLVERDEASDQLRASAAGGTLLMVDTASNEMLDTMPVGNFPVSLGVGIAAGVATPTSTVGPSPTPTAGEVCGATRCLPPSICSRDLGCHRNGCTPRDKCCPPEAPDCATCVGGANDGAACSGQDDCPDGTCAP